MSTLATSSICRPGLYNNKDRTDIYNVFGPVYHTELKKEIDIECEFLVYQSRQSGDIFMVRPHRFMEMVTGRIGDGDPIVWLKARFGPDPRPGIYCHVKSGNEYRVLGAATIAGSEQRFAIYEPLVRGRIPCYARPIEMFKDTDPATNVPRFLYVRRS